MLLEQIILSEAGTTLELNDKLKSIYKEQFNQWPLEHPLYRWREDVENTISLREPRERRSLSKAGTAPLQTHIFNTTAWVGWPERQYSIFTMTKPGGAFVINGKEDDHVYMVIPRNGTKVAVWDGPDFNMVRLPYLGYKPTQAFSAFDDLFRFIDTDSFDTAEFLTNSKWINGSYDDEFEVDAIKWYNTDFPFRQRIAQDLEKALKAEGLYDTQHQKVKDILNWHLDPTTFASPDVVGAELVTTASVPSEIFETPREAWFSGEYLIINTNLWDDFVKFVKE